MTNKKQFSASAYVQRADVPQSDSHGTAGPLRGSGGLLRKAVHEYREAPAHRGREHQRLRVLSVEPGSLAARIGLKSGDEILELNGRPLLDVIDFQFNAATVGRRTTIRTQDKTITFVRREWESFGFE